MPWTVAVVALAVLAVACAGDGGGDRLAAEPDPSATAAPPMHRTVVLVDPDRVTPGVPGRPAEIDRTLPTDLYEPSGEGPFPLIAFAHGLDGNPGKFTRLFTAWAEAGYVVVAPRFPLSHDTATADGGVLADFPDQALDMRFVLDQVLGAETPLTVSVDPDRVGAGGLSLGGATTYNLAFDGCCRDDRLVAAAVFDPLRLEVDGLDLGAGLPTLLVHADGDPVLPHADTARAFAEIAPPAWFVTLHEAVHAQPYEDAIDPADDLVVELSIAFWDRYVKGDDAAEERMTAAVGSAGDLASMEVKSG